MLKLIKDPLLHFLLLGGALFAVSLWRDGGETADRITISAEQVEELRRSAELTQGRPPTEAELAQLVENAVRDEVFYREALALELDVDDDEVRRRLIEKMRYLTEDLANPTPATDAELEAFYESSPELFTIPEQVTFDQVYFSPQVRGEKLEADAMAALRRLNQGEDPAGVGDRTPLQQRFFDAQREQVRVLFGEDLLNAVYTMEPGQWSGPYRSAFGLHLVRVVSRTPQRLPPLEEVRERALELYAEHKRRQHNEAEYGRMRARYDIEIEWPERQAKEAS